jgi:hypothetical protein
MEYYVCRGSHDRIVQFVVDELWAKYHRELPIPGETPAQTRKRIRGAT